jgi:hypothetical protein
MRPEGDFSMSRKCHHVVSFPLLAKRRPLLAPLRRAPPVSCSLQHAPFLFVGGDKLAGREEPHEHAVWAVEHLGGKGGDVALRAYNGHYVAVNKHGQGTELALIHHRVISDRIVGPALA